MEVIPRRLVRTVPEAVNAEQEHLWDIACGLHPGLEHVTLRDPVDRDLFPLTSEHWDTCESGAQLADLIRAEELYHRGGCYIDADFLCLRPFDSLLPLPGFAGWEDNLYIPNACMGFAPRHPALSEVIFRSIARHNRGTWAAGVGVTTEVFRERTDMLLLPPGSFYAVHWRTAHVHGVDVEKVRSENPWAFGIHLYAHSWWEKEKSS